MQDLEFKCCLAGAADKCMEQKTKCTKMLSDIVKLWQFGQLKEIKIDDLPF